MLDVELVKFYVFYSLIYVYLSFHICDMIRS